MDDILYDKIDGSSVFISKMIDGSKIDKIEFNVSMTCGLTSLLCKAYNFNKGVKITPTTIWHTFLKNLSIYLNRINPDDIYNIFGHTHDVLNELTRGKMLLRKGNIYDDPKTLIHIYLNECRNIVSDKNEIINMLSGVAWENETDSDILMTSLLLFDKCDEHIIYNKPNEKIIIDEQDIVLEKGKIISYEIAGSEENYLVIIEKIKMICKLVSNEYYKYWLEEKTIPFINLLSRLTKDIPDSDDILKLNNFFYTFKNEFGTFVGGLHLTMIPYLFVRYEKQIKLEERLTLHYNNASINIKYLPNSNVKYVINIVPNKITVSFGNTSVKYIYSGSFNYIREKDNIYELKSLVKIDEK